MGACAVSPPVSIIDEDRTLTVGFAVFGVGLEAGAKNDMIKETISANIFYFFIDELMQQPEICLRCGDAFKQEALLNFFGNRWSDNGDL
ncbi:hypothetical protein KTO63_22360 [Parasegetibacter sp. MAH-26]|uniref:Uncharacterized protein n=1 Tax=Pinibacter aurantiacus TaxID=2851599 RepID=A0A9E2W4L8_9BACT|nr:hypothetical protein [Pinibacter aurantiacus]